MKFSLFAFGITTILATCNYRDSCYSVRRQSYSRPKYQTTKTYGGYGGYGSYGSSSTSNGNGVSVTQTTTSQSSNGQNGGSSTITVSNENTEVLPINENQIVVEQTQQTNGGEVLTQPTQYVEQTTTQIPVQTTQVIDPVITEQPTTVTTTTTTGSNTNIKSTKPYTYSYGTYSRSPITYTYSWSSSPRYSSRTYYKSPSYTTIRSTPCKVSLSKRSKYDRCY